MYRKLNFHTITEITSDIRSSFLVFARWKLGMMIYLSRYMLSIDPSLYFVSTRPDLGIYILKSLKVSFVYVISDLCLFGIQSSTIIY